MTGGAIGRLIRPNDGNRPIAVETHVSGRRRMIALSESQREPTDWDRRIHGDPRRAYAGEVVHADLEPANAAADRIARGGTRSGKALASLAPPPGQLMGIWIDPVRVRAVVRPDVGAGPAAFGA